MDKSHTFRIVSAGSPIKRLIDAGIIPPMCTHFELVIESGSPVRIKAECYATEEQLDEICAALEEDEEAARGIARSIVFRSMTDPENNVNVELTGGI